MAIKLTQLCQEELMKHLISSNSQLLNYFLIYLHLFYHV
jgi:hypothetical protein